MTAAEPSIRTYAPGGAFAGTIGREMSDSIQAYPDIVRPPSGAPNVVFIVLDDVGFAQLGCYGSDIDTPNLDRLAAGGLRYRSFHTTAMCSPTRAALLTGRNHHSVGMGTVSEMATGFPGFDGRIDRDTGFLSEVLRDNGYATWAVGKWHLTPREETDLAASRARWPLGRGFERFYGFLGAETNQYAPDLVADNQFVPQPYSAAEGYHLTADLVDHSIEFINDLRNVTTRKPFFLQLAFGACHAPHQAPPEFIGAHSGRFDAGWDEWRAAAHARQLDMGILPAGTALTERPPWIAEWASLTDDEKRVHARLMEVYAGFLSHTDHHIGRLIDHLATTGDLDNTILMVLSDNGASPEGGPHGAWNMMRLYNGAPLTFESASEHLDLMGTPESFSHYSSGWALAGNAPFQRWKRECHEGGVADPLLVHWPAGIAGAGEVRSQYLHVIDLMPTVLDAIGIDMPSAMAGVAQKPIEGRSMLATFTDADSPIERSTQYYEMVGCRAIYHEGWKAVAYHPTRAHNYVPLDPDAPASQDRWELYHVAVDVSESRDLASDHPEKVREMIERWFVEAGRHDAMPVHHQRPFDAARPHHVERTVRTVLRPGGPIANAVAVDVRHRPSLTVASVQYAEGDEGVLIAHGGRFGGYSLYVQDGRLHYTHNLLGDERFRVSSPTIPAGARRLGYSFTPTGDRSGLVELVVDDEVVASGEVPRTTEIAHSLFGDPLCVGYDDGTPVDDTYESPFAFTGVLHSVVVDVSGMPHRDLALEREAHRASQ